MINIFRKQNNNLKELKPFNNFFKNGINKSSFLHIYNNENIDETILISEILNRNNNDIFIYMDCYYNLKKELPNNTFYLNTNNIDILIDILSNIKKKSIDYVIINGFGNLNYNEESFDKHDTRYKMINSKISILLDLCFKNKITLIAFNSLTGLNKPTCFSTQIESQFNFNAQIIAINDNIITLESYKNTYGKNDIINISYKEVK